MIAGWLKRGSGQAEEPELSAGRGPFAWWIRTCIEQRLVVFLFAGLLALWGLHVTPFSKDHERSDLLADFHLDELPRNPVSVDALPDIGENQQIVFVEWPGRSPQDVEDQVTYPLSVALLGVPGVRTVRSFSMFGFASIYVLFDEDVEFYWSRSRILEKLASLPADALPPEVQPSLGPDATGLGQVFWYTLEGRNPAGEATGGWDLHELRSIQDWIVRYALASASGISEVASVGGFVQEYQVDVDPDAMRAHGVTLGDVTQAVRHSNLDVGARTIEINKVEYVIRGRGFVESLEDLEETVVRVADNVPIYVKDVAHVSLGPALRRGALDRAGVEAVGGVAVVRYGANPMEAIKNLKREIETIAPGLPARVLFDEREIATADVVRFARREGIHGPGDPYSEELQELWLTWLRQVPMADWPPWVELSQVTIVPFYDRTQLIDETLGTLENALAAELLITSLVVLLMVAHLASSLLISALLLLSVGATFVLMKLTGVDANIVALAGIAIAIGTMVDMGIVISENVLRRLSEDQGAHDKKEVVTAAAREVGGAVVTSVATTVIAFLPVFALSGAEGRLFKPLAWTKTFALVAALVLSISLLPPAAYVLFGAGKRERRIGMLRTGLRGGAGIGATIVGFLVTPLIGLLALVVTAFLLLSPRLAGYARRTVVTALHAAVAIALVLLLADHWAPLGPMASTIGNLVFCVIGVGGILGLFLLFRRAYPTLLRWALANKVLALSPALVLTLLGSFAWLGFPRVFRPLAGWLEGSAVWSFGERTFPGLGREFMPSLDEGSFLFMPTTMPHASIGEAFDTLQAQDAAIAAVPEVASVVGKIGRVDSALDPAPIGMIETIIRYHPEFARDEDGEVKRLWRDEIRSPEDIWHEILHAAEMPGTTSAPHLQPIAGRLVMLQSGMRAPMGIKVKGPDLTTIEDFGLELERLLKEAPGVQPDAVLADRIVGKPYIEIELDRKALARYGLHVSIVQEVIEVGIGGKRLTTTVEGRERYPVRVRYGRELRDDFERLGRILVPTPAGPQIPLSHLAELRFVRGPQTIKSEDTLPVGYVIFDKLPGLAEVDVVEACRDHLAAKIEAGELVVPRGVSYRFTGTYEHQLRAQRTLSFVVPLSVLLIFTILYLQFRSVVTTLIVGSGVAVAWAGGFLFLWLYGRELLADVHLLGVPFSDLFGIEPRNLSVAVWVGFLALFGVATDDGVLIATYLRDGYREGNAATLTQVREVALEAGKRRIRPCLMTTASTLLALLPVLGATGRGADLLVPMAIPSFGGMAVALLSIFVVPVLYCWSEELKLFVRRTTS